MFFLGGTVPPSFLRRKKKEKQESWQFNSSFWDVRRAAWNTRKLLIYIEPKLVHYPGTYSRPVDSASTYDTLSSF